MQMMWTPAPENVYEQARPVTSVEMLEALDGCGKWFVVLIHGEWQFASMPQALPYGSHFEHIFVFRDGTVFAADWAGLRVTDLDMPPPVEDDYHSVDETVVNHDHWDGWEDYHDAVYMAGGFVDDY